MKYEDLKIDLRNANKLIAKRFPNKDLVTFEETFEDYLDLLDMIDSFEVWLLTQIRYGSSDEEYTLIEVHNKLTELKKEI